MNKKIGKILASVILLSYIPSATYAENIFENLFSSENSQKWTGVCQSIIECPDKRADDNFYEQNPDYKNWVLNSSLRGKDYTNSGIAFLNELPGKSTATTNISIKNFEPEDTYSLSFDLVGVYNGNSFVDKPYLQIQFGDFKAEEYDKTSVLSSKITSIPTYNPARNTTKYINADTFKGQKGYLIDSTLLVPGKSTTIEIIEKGKDICKDCKKGENFETNLNFSAILINNLTSELQPKYLGSDFVIKNISGTQKDTTLPENPTLSDWSKNPAKDEDEVSITLKNVEENAKVEIEGMTCTPEKATKTGEVICKATVNPFDGTERVIKIIDENGNENINLKTPVLTIDNISPEIDFSEIILNNGKETITNEKNSNELEINLGNTINLNTFLAKFSDNGTEENFSDIKNISSDIKINDKGEVNISETGTHKIIFTAIDKAGNETIRILYVKVKENDKTELEEEISKENIKDDIIYKNASEKLKNAYDKALEDAKFEKPDTNLTLDKIEEIKNNLKVAREALNGVDKEKLKEEISKKIIKDEIIYKNDSSEDKSNYDKTLEEAEKIFEKENATQKEIDEVTEKLKKAREALDGKENIVSNTKVEGYSVSPGSLILKDDSRVFTGNEVKTEVKIETKQEETNLESNTENKKEEIKTKDKKFIFEPVAPILSEEIKTENSNNTEIIEPKQKENLFTKYPKKLPKTGAIDGTEIIKKAGKVKNVNKNLEISLPKAETFKLAGNINSDLNFWLEVLDEKYRNGNKYVVIPSSGLVVPVNNVENSSKEAKNFLSGNEETFSKYLETGSVELPGTVNKVIGGHSSDWKNKKGDFKTHFQKIIGMEKNEEIWIYEKNSSGNFVRYVYQVSASYNTKAEDISILKSTDKNELVLFTCTPIGGNAGRWIVKAKFTGN